MIRKISYPILPERWFETYERYPAWPPFLMPASFLLLTNSPPHIIILHTLHTFQTPHIPFATHLYQDPFTVNGASPSSTTQTSARRCTETTGDCGGGGGGGGRSAHGPPRGKYRTARHSAAHRAAGRARSGAEPHQRPVRLRNIIS